MAKKWYEGLEDIQKLKAAYRPSMFFSGYGANGKLEPNKPTNMVMVNGKPSIMHEGEVATNNSIIPANMVRPMTKPASTEKQQKRLSKVQSKYGMSGYVGGFNIDQYVNNNIPDQQLPSTDEASVGYGITPALGQIDINMSSPSLTKPIGLATSVGTNAINIDTNVSNPTPTSTSGTATQVSTGIAPIDTSAVDNYNPLAGGAPKGLATNTGGLIKNTQPVGATTNFVDPTMTADMIKNAATNLQNIATYQDPAYRNMVNTQIQKFRASSAALGQGLQSQLANIPGLSTGAKTAAMASYLRDVGADESTLRGELAKTAGENALKASEQYATLATNLVTAGIDEKNANAYVKNLENENNWKTFEETINEGNWQEAGRLAETLGFTFDSSRYEDKLDADRADYLTKIADGLIDSNPYLAGKFYAKAASILTGTLKVETYDPSWTTEFTTIDQTEGGWGSETNQELIKQIYKDLNKPVVDANEDELLDISLDDYKQWKLNKEMAPITDENGNETLSPEALNVVGPIISKDVYDWATGDEGAVTLGSWVYNMSVTGDRSDNMLYKLIETFKSDPTLASINLDNPNFKEDIFKFARMMFIMSKDGSSYTTNPYNFSQDDINFANTYGYQIKNTTLTPSSPDEINSTPNKEAIGKVEDRLPRSGYLVNEENKINVTSSEARLFIGNPDYEAETFAREKMYVDDWGPRNIGKILTTPNGEHYLIESMSHVAKKEPDTVQVRRIDKGYNNRLDLYTTDILDMLYPGEGLGRK